MMAGDIRLYLRLKPSVKNTPDSSFYRINGETELQLLVPPNNREPYQFSQIYSSPDDECCTVLSQVCANSLISGTNCSVFAIGSNHTGKTYTMFGDSSGKNIKKSLSFNLVSHLFEKLKTTPKEKNCSITVNFIEIFNDKVKDLGLAYYKRSELRMNQVSDIIEMQDLDIKEVAGRSYVEDASIIQVINANEIIDIISMGLRVKEYIASRGDTILCITLSQKLKNEIQSARVYLVDFTSTGFIDTSEESTLGCLQKVLNKANLINLGVPVKTIPMKIHKVTYLCQGSILNSTVMVISTVDSDPGKFKETYELLNYTRTILEIDKKIKMNMMPHNTSARSTEWAKRLKEEIGDLDSNIKKSQNLHEEKLRSLGKLLGIDEDLELLVSAEKGTREYEVCRKFREALSTVNNLNTRNDILEKKIEKFKREMSDLHIVQRSNIDKNRNYLNKLRNELINVKSKIEDYDYGRESGVMEKMMMSTESLEKMLYQSHCTLEEGSIFLNSLKQNIEGNTTDLKNLLEAKDIVKSEIENDYKRQIIDNDYFHKQQLLSLETDFKKNMKEKYDEIFNESHEYALKIRDIDSKISESQSEAARLFEVARCQGKAIHDIEAGKFNKGICPVLIPRNHIPPVPNPSKFPLIFATLGSHALEIARVSSKLKAQFSYKKLKSQSSSLLERSIKEQEPANFYVDFSIESLLNVPADECRITELRTIGQQLQKMIRENTSKVHEINKSIKKTQDIMKEKQTDLDNAKKESKKLKDSYQEMFKKRLEKSDIESRPHSRAFLTELSRPGTQRNFDVNSKMLRNVYTTVSGHRLPISRSSLNVQVETARPFTCMSTAGFVRRTSNL